MFVAGFPVEDYWYVCTWCFDMRDGPLVFTGGFVSPEERDESMKNHRITRHTPPHEPEPERAGPFLLDDLVTMRAVSYCRVCNYGATDDAPKEEWEAVPEEARTNWYQSIETRMRSEHEKVPFGG